MSLQMHMVAAYVRLNRKRSLATNGAARRRLAAPKGPSAPPGQLRARHRVSRRQGRRL